MIIENNLERLQNIKNNQNTNKAKKNIYVKKELFEQAQRHSSNYNSYGVVYGDKVLSISEKNLNDLKNIFKKDMLQYENIYVAKGDAKNYLDQISNLVLKDLNVKNADKDNNGIISYAESLDVKNILDFQSNSILKPRDVLNEEDIKKIEQNNSTFMSINDIINLNIKIDKNKDGEVSFKEIGLHIYQKNEKNLSSLNDSGGIDPFLAAKGGGNPLEGTTSITDEEKMEKLKELFKKLNEIQKKLNDLTIKLQSASDREKMLLNDQINQLNAQMAVVLTQIFQIYKQLLGQ